MTNFTVNFTPTAEQLQKIGQAIATTLWDKAMAQLRHEMAVLRLRARGYTDTENEAPLRDWLMTPNQAAATAPAQTPPVPPRPTKDLVIKRTTSMPRYCDITTTDPAINEFIKREAPRFGNLFKDIGTDEAHGRWDWNLYIAPNYDPAEVERYLASGGKASS